MKAVTRSITVDAAFAAIDRLSEAGIYAGRSGCQSRGYEVLVRESQANAAVEALGTANDTSQSLQLTPEVTK